ncbi:MAG: DUF3465 domain-containing protein [Planctomycetota bacterium]|jgi:hypothetical protein
MRLKSKPLSIVLIVLIAVAAVALRSVIDGNGSQAPAPSTAGAPAGGTQPSAEAGAATGEALIADAFAQRRDGIIVEAGGVVTRTLPDDREGSPHQRFIVRLGSGHTVLVAHNIDLAERVPVAEGDRVAFRGQYEWNDRGGVIHWTHHDPEGRRPGGWIRHHGATFR